ncbi:hypothetical protein JNK13_08540 [bacterium]|nr:hypothetical protein [bacterium]
MPNISRRVVIKDVLLGAHQPGIKPSKWDERKDRLEIVTTCSGEELALISKGAQSTPAAGWELMLSGQSLWQGQTAYYWTLYGITNSAQVLN